MTSFTLGAAFVVAATAIAQAPPGLPDLEPIKKSLTELRGLEFKAPVPPIRQTREELGTFIDEWIAKVLPPDRAEQIELGMRRLGMLTEPGRLTDSFRQMMVSGAGAYYDQKRKHIVFLEDFPGMMDMIARHELMHALQDQHFDLEKLIEPFERFELGVPRQEDAELALRCLVEGEATYIDTVHMMAKFGGAPGEELEMLRMQASMGFEDFPVDATEGPRYLTHSMLVSYMQGAYMVGVLLQHGGWDAVSAAFVRPPRSAEQALHPEKLTTDPDEPTPIAFADLASLRDSGWTEIDAAVHGEFYLGILLQNFGTNRSNARRATEGWDGDLYRAYRDADGRVLVALVTTWDTEDDAREFLAAYDSILERRYPKLSRIADRPFYDCGDAELGTDLVTDLGTGCAAQRGTEVFIVEGGERELVGRILDELRAIPIERVE